MNYQYHGATAQADIYKTLAHIERFGFDFGDIYRDWLELMCAALTKDEAAYMETLKRYERFNDREKGQRPADRFAEAYSKLCLAWRADSLDHLGELYQQYVSRGAHGQYFTPESVVQLMAEMTSPTLEAGQSVCDPACGSGRTLIAAAKRGHGGKFYGIDIDRRCVQMAALNLVHRNMEGVIVWGNALSLEQHGAYVISASVYGAEIRFVDKHHEIPISIMGMPFEQSPATSPEPVKEETHQRQQMELEL